MFLTAAAAAARFLTIYHPEISICRSIHSESPPPPGHDQQWRGGGVENVRPEGWFHQPTLQHCVAEPLLTFLLLHGGA